MKSNYTKGQLWEDRFWGWDIIDPPDSTIFNPKIRQTTPKNQRTVELVLRAPCRANWIRVTGRGYYYWEGVLHRSPEMSSERYVDCER